MKRGCIQLVCIFVTLAGPLRLVALGPEQPFSVTLEAPDKPVKAGVELVLHATIKNTSDKKVQFPTSLGLIPPDWFRYQIHVLDARARAAPPSARITGVRKLQREGRPVLPVPPFSNTTHILKPGESFVDEINVSQDYDLSRPGTYTIWVIHPLPLQVPPWAPKKYWKGSVRSNKVKVVIIK